MTRNYSLIQQYEKEILRLKEEGYAKREIGENFGFSCVLFDKQNTKNRSKNTNRE